VPGDQRLATRRVAAARRPPALEHARPHASIRGRDRGDRARRLRSRLRRCPTPIRVDTRWGQALPPAARAIAAHGPRPRAHAWGESAPRRPRAARPTPTSRTTSPNSQLIAQAQVMSLVAEACSSASLARVALLDAGSSWVPPMLWRFDKGLEGRLARGAVAEGAPLGVRPPPLPRDDGAGAAARGPPSRRRSSPRCLGPASWLRSDHPHRHGEGTGRAALRCSPMRGRSAVWRATPQLLPADRVSPPRQPAPFPHRSIPGSRAGSPSAIRPRRSRQQVASARAFVAPIGRTSAPVTLNCAGRCGRCPSRGAEEIPSTAARRRARRSPAGPRGGRRPVR